MSTGKYRRIVSFHFEDDPELVIEIENEETLDPEYREEIEKWKTLSDAGLFKRIKNSFELQENETLKVCRVIREGTVFEDARLNSVKRNEFHNEVHTLSNIFDYEDYEWDEVDNENQE